jgi:peptide/nickel transport system permease protein
LLKRLLLTLPAIVGVITIVFLLLHLIPGDPVEIMLGDTAVSAQKEQLRHDLGLDQPLLQQYGRFWSGVLHGDLGKSIASGESDAEQEAH